VLKIKYDRGSSPLLPVGISYAALLKVSRLPDTPYSRFPRSCKIPCERRTCACIIRLPCPPFASLIGTVRFPTVTDKRLVRLLSPGAAQQVHCSFGAGRPGQTYDMLLAADGVNSKVRWALFPPKDYGVKQVSTNTCLLPSPV
jgi:hypothetical protein